MSSPLEEMLALQIRADGLPQPVREFAAVPGRRYRFDFAFVGPECGFVADIGCRGVLVECEGGIWIRGGHSTGAGIEGDMEKANLGQIAGYKVIRVSARHIKSGDALKWIREALFNR